MQRPESLTAKQLTRSNLCQKKQNTHQPTAPEKRRAASARSRAAPAAQRPRRHAAPQLPPQRQLPPRPSRAEGPQGQESCKEGRPPPPLPRSRPRKISRSIRIDRAAQDRQGQGQQERPQRRCPRPCDLQQHDRLHHRPERLRDRLVQRRQGAASRAPARAPLTPRRWLRRMPAARPWATA